MTEANGMVDEGFLQRYRQLLDAEDTAFDELEHAYEDGDRAHYDHEFAEWQAIVERRQSLLERYGLPPVQAGVRAQASTRCAWRQGRRACPPSRSRPPRR